MDKPFVAPEVLTILGSNHGSTDGKKKTRDRFTAEMKDRQARGKDVMTGKESKDEARMTQQEKEDAKGDGKGSAKIHWWGDSEDAIEKRGRAEAILASRELLTMYAQERGDSIASSRHHLQQIMCGIEDPRKPLKPGKVMSPSADDPNPGLPYSTGIIRKNSSVLDNSAIPLRPNERNDRHGEESNAEDAENLTPEDGSA